APRPQAASGSLLTPETGRGLPSSTDSRPRAPRSRRCCSSWRRKAPTAKPSTRRPRVVRWGRRGGRSLVVDQFWGRQAQARGRSCRAAQRRTATRTQGWKETYFWWKRLATARRAWYNGGQSSRSMADLLGWALYQGIRDGA